MLIMGDYSEIYNAQRYACGVIKLDLSYYHLCCKYKDNNINHHFANSETLVVDGGTISKSSNLFKSYASKVVKYIYIYIYIYITMVTSIF